MPNRRPLPLRVLGRPGILPHLNWQARVTLNGARLHLPVRGLTGLDHLQPAEPWLDGLLAQLLSNRPGLFIDVGVNIGQTLLKVKSVQADRPYLGFEPNPLCVAYVDALIQANHFRDCRVVPAWANSRPWSACSRATRLASIDAHSNLEWCDYLFFPAEQQAELQGVLAQSAT